MKKHLYKIFILGTLLIGLPLISLAWFQITQPKAIKTESKQNDNTQKSQKNESNPVSDWTEYEKVRKRIFELSNARDLYGLVKLQEEVEGTWGKTQPISSLTKANLYAGLMYEICGSFASQEFNNNERYSLARKCVKKALETRDKMLVWQEVELVPLSTTPEYLDKVFTEEQWKADRKKRAEFWFHAWQRLENEIDKNYDFESNRPKKISNLSTEEKEIAENYTKQVKLHKLMKNFSKQFQDFVFWTYTLPPYDNSELENFLNKYVSDVELKDSILQKVNLKIKGEILKENNEKH